jgi:hypothetical protein
MIAIDSNDFRNIIGQSAIQRGLGQFEIAAKVLEGVMHDLDEPAKEIALLQLIYVYADAGNLQKCREYAAELAKYDSEIPTVKKLLSTL